MDQEEGLSAVDNIVTQFNTYEDFLDSQITTVDLYYLEVRAAAPQSGHCLPVLGSFPIPRVVGFSPPGGGRQAPQFPDGDSGGEFHAAPFPPCSALVGTEFRPLVAPGAETRVCAG